MMWILAYLAYLPVAFIVSGLIAWKFVKKAVWIKLLSFVGVFLILGVGPIIDLIISGFYAQNLCETKIRGEVYKVVELPPEFWGENGKLIIDSRRVTGRNYYAVSMIANEHISRYIRVKQFSETYRFGTTIKYHVVENVATGEIVGVDPSEAEVDYYGGWLVRTFFPTEDASALFCTTYDRERMKETRKVRKEWLAQQFAPSQTDTGE